MTTTAKRTYVMKAQYEPLSPAKKVGSSKDFIARANAILERAGNNVFGSYKRKLMKARAQTTNQ